MLPKVLEQVENGYLQTCNHKKTVPKTFIDYSLLTRELASVLKEQVVGETSVNRTFFHVPKCWTRVFQHPKICTFFAGHKTKASPNSFTGKNTRLTDCATHRKYRTGKTKWQKTKVVRTNFFGAKFLGYRRYPFTQKEEFLWCRVRLYR